MQILLFLLGIIIGGIVLLGIAHAYYKRASQDQNALFNKLSKEVRDAILGANLNELIREKTIDKEVGEAIPYMACPKCGSEDLDRISDVEVDYGPEGPESACHYDIVTCKKCNWTKTSHGYESTRDDI